MPGSKARDKAGAAGRRVRLGEVVGLHGLQGWLKLHSDTEPREGIFAYRPLIIGGESVVQFDSKIQNRSLLLHIHGRDDRTAVESLMGAAIEVAREQLPELSSGEFYWSDLQGLRVVSTTGHEFGQVVRLMSTGANDVLVVRGSRETLIPFVQGVYVLEVDLDGAVIRVDWSPEYL